MKKIIALVGLTILSIATSFLTISIKSSVILDDLHVSKGFPIPFYFVPINQCNSYGLCTFMSIQEIWKLENFILNSIAWGVLYLIISLSLRTIFGKLRK